jgi:hypothetical protein
MNLLSHLAVAAGFATLAFAAAPSGAEAQYRGGHHYDRGYGHGWNGPEGHFLVYANACPDLREDFRDRRHSYGRHRGRGDWRDRRVLDCPPHAWRYIPSYRERRMGRTGERLRPDVAFFDRRTGRYEVQTRWGEIPVEIVWGHGPRYDYGHRSGWTFSWSSGW